MSEKNDDLFFCDNFSEEEKNCKDCWKVLIADDDEDVHSVTKMVLSDISFDGLPVKVLSAYSTSEILRIIEEDGDIAVVLLDVVMEHEHSGLEIVKKIREELKNQFVRIILRTGQPGQAPEIKVIAEYDINDYKQKTDLTAQKLFTTIISSLRAYRDLKTIEKNRIGLEKIIEVSKKLFEIQDVDKFIDEVLISTCDVLGSCRSVKCENVSGFIAEESKGEFVVISGLGVYVDSKDIYMREIVTHDLQTEIKSFTDKDKSFFAGEGYLCYFYAKEQRRILMFINIDDKFRDIERNLLKLFLANISVALDNIYLNHEIVETQKEMIFTLSEVIERRSHETANHVRRVSALSCLLAEKTGLSANDIELIEAACPLHDIGKIGISDVILNKPGKLTKEEYEKIKEHPVIGYEILRSSKRAILKAAAIIAYQHQEKWDGTGYPQGLKGNEIHIFSRITTLIDVFDALCQTRIYKEAWALDKVFAFIEENRGKYFDPNLVDIFIECKQEFIDIMLEYPD